MWLRVEHTTTFAYEAPIVEAYTELRLRPLDVGGQRCASFQLATTPAGTRVREYRDHRGNTVSHFDLLEPHQQLVVTARSNVFTPAVLADSAALSLLDAHHDYLGADAATSRSTERRRHSQPSTPEPEQPGNAQRA